MVTTVTLDMPAMPAMPDPPSDPLQIPQLAEDVESARDAYYTARADNEHPLIINLLRTNYRLHMLERLSTSDVTPLTTRISDLICMITKVNATVKKKHEYITGEQQRIQENYMKFVNSQAENQNDDDDDGFVII